MTLKLKFHQQVCIWPIYTFDKTFFYKSARCINRLDLAKDAMTKNFAGLGISQGAILNENKSVKNIAKLF